jgi:D-alanine-D-alanine ligase
VLKPVNEGSSVGVAIVTDESNYGNPIGRDTKGPWNDFETAGRAVRRGRELTVAVLGDEAFVRDRTQAQVGFYDFDSKYTDGLTEHVCPAECPDEIAQSMLDMALTAHRVLGCKGPAGRTSAGTTSRASRHLPARDQHPARA